MAVLSKPRRFAGVAAALVLPAALIIPLASSGSASDDASPDEEIVPDGPEEVEVVKVTVPDRDALDALVETEMDLAEEVTETADGLVVEAIITPSEQEELREAGFTVGEPLLTEDDFRALQEERQEMAATAEAAEFQALQEGDDLRVQRAAWFEHYEGDFIEIEVWSEAGSGSSSVILTVSLDAGPGTEIGDGGTFNLSRLVDAGHYMFHRTNVPRPVDEVPSRMRVTATLSGEVIGEVEAEFTEYLDGEYPNGPGAPKEWGDIATSFVDRYIDPTEAHEWIESLADEFPHLAEIVEMPYETNGYRRHAQHLTTGVLTSQAVAITSHAWGHEGGNDLTIEYVNPGVANSPLGVSVDGTDITVSLATDGSGNLSSTAAQVVNAINNDAAASELIFAHTYRGNAGNGITQARAQEGLSDFLSAPDHISRDPFTPKVLRIGKHRDGSKVGVYLYSQEHAREWVTPLVAVETAERLLRNYDSSAQIRKLVDNLDIFIAPSINPDGAHYSIYDRTLQRRNMTNHCPVTGASDANARNSWGVDINRNFRVGNFAQGFSGGSGSCTSDVFAGPEPLSEPEAQNEVWTVENFSNIRFAMNTHTHGGYFMWAPGAYQLPSRDGLERPSYGIESFFYEASDLILNRIKEHRGSIVWPSRVGPVSDVLYSAAGNSADDHFYSNDIFAWSFEAGSPLWTGSGWSSVGFTPPYSEGHEEAMEFSHGWLGILEVAYMYSMDKIKPKSTLEPGQGTYDGPVEVTFDLSEPADVYYTLDGSRPTYDSPRIEFTGPRQGQQPILIDETTTIHWFSVDVAGNVEKNYNPDGNGRNYSKATIRIRN